MKFDSIFPVLGDFGRGQIIQYSILCFPYIIAGILSVDAVFLFATPDFVCQPSQELMKNIKTTLNSTNNGEIAERLFKFLEKNKLQKSQCYEWNNETNIIDALLSNSSFVNSTFTTNQTCSNGFIYSEESYGNTITRDFDMVCNRAYIRTNLKTIFFVGRILGAIVFGQISDLIGRLLGFLIAVVCNITCGIGLYFSQGSISLGVFMLIQGLTQVGYTLTTYVLGCEMIGTSKRKVAGSVFFIFYTFAFLIIPLVYYFLKSWRILALISGLPAIGFLSYYFIVHESPRWLISKGKLKKANKIIKMIAHRNGKEFPKELEEEILNHVVDKDAEKASVLDLFKTPKLFLLTLNVSFNWIVNSLIYYGIIFNTENLGLNLYINFAIMGLVEIPSLLLNMVLLDRLGRRNLLIITLIATGACCLIAGCIPADYKYIGALFAILGKFTVSMSYGVVYFFTFELYPTVVRNVAMGVCSMSARIGGMFAVQILSLQVYLNALPMLVFFIMSVMAGVLTWFIPETMGQALDSKSQPDQTTNDVGVKKDSEMGDFKKSEEALELINKENSKDDPVV